jgi:invasion protein IalB
MSMKLTIAIAASLTLVMSSLAMSAALADNGARVKAKYHRHALVAASAAELPTAPGTLVLHPSWSFACQTPYDLSRNLPCDQPIWVYGKPCEIGLGLGRWTSCDEQ